mmetsp:Transcript_100018/g.291744  ORF Transcript_100018/g.291744 Transcript_100018/m.291744 type:complete len:227 (+) Transcript_100018:577-1257(+)
MKGQGLVSPLLLAFPGTLATLVAALLILAVGRLPSPLLFCLPGHLLLHQGAVDLAMGHELLVAALLEHLTVVDDDDLVGVHDRCEPVRDDHDAAGALHGGDHVVQGVLDLLLVLRVQGARGLVQEQELGPPQQRPRDGEPLLLAAAEAVAGLAHQGVVAALHLHDELVRVGPLGGGLHGLLAVLLRLEAVRQVVAHAPRKDLRILAHDADPPLEAPEVHLRQRLAL